MAFNTIQARQERQKLIEALRKLHDGTTERNVETAEEREQKDRYKADITKWDVTIRDEEYLQQQEADAAKSLVENREGNDPRKPQWDGINQWRPGFTQPTPTELARGTSLIFHNWLGYGKRGFQVDEEAKSWSQRLGINFADREIPMPLIKHYRTFRRQIWLEQRDLNIVTSTKGVETIPEGFVYSLEEALLAFGGMRGVSDVFRTDNVSDVPWPTVNDTSNVGVILGEATDFGSSVDPVFGAKVFHAHKYSSKPIKISTELLQDSPFDLPSRLGAMLGERIARIQNQHFTTGTGTSMPTGVTIEATTGFAAAGAAIEADDVFRLIHALDPAYRANARFMMHDQILMAVRLLKETTTNAYIWQPGLQLGVPDRLAGYPYTVNQDMEDTQESGGLVMMLFGDFSKYKIRDVATLRLIRLDELYAATDQVGFVAYMRSDGGEVDAGTHPIVKLTISGS